jgi:hypothetical protein
MTKIFRTAIRWLRSDNPKSKACPEQRRRIQNLKGSGILAIAVTLLSCGQPPTRRTEKQDQNRDSECFDMLPAFVCRSAWKVFEDNGLDVEIIQMRPRSRQNAPRKVKSRFFVAVLLRMTHTTVEPGAAINLDTSRVSRIFLST